MILLWLLFAFVTVTILLLSRYNILLPQHSCTSVYAYSFLYTLLVLTLIHKSYNYVIITENKTA